jgi:hypothetical protein
VVGLPVRAAVDAAAPDVAGVRLLRRDLGQSRDSGSDIWCARGRFGLIGLLISLLVGLEAGTLRRFTLGGRGWKNLGVVSGDDREDAERRFFDAWLQRKNSPSSAPHTPMPGPAAAAPNRRGPLGSDVIGLFPEPGAPR